MEDGGFTLAGKANRKGRRRHIFRQSIGGGAIVAKRRNPAGTSAKSSENCSIESEMEGIEANLRALRKRFPAEYITNTIDTVSGLLNGRRLVRIRILGIGSFGESLPAAFQLILVEEVRNHFSVQDISSQDPIATLAEMKYLQARGIKTPPTDTFTLNLSEDGGEVDGGVTLYYMIHCEHFMYENVLRANWSRKSLRDLLIVGNDFRNYSAENFRPPPPGSIPNCLRVGTTTADENGNNGNGHVHEFAALTAFASISQQIKLEIPLEPYVFSDTFVVYLDGECSIPNL